MMDVINPATGEVAGSVTLHTARDVEEVLSRARSVSLSADERYVLLRKLHRRVLERAEEIAETVALEQGKPIVESMTAEVFGSLDHLRFTLRNFRSTLKFKKKSPRQILFSSKSHRLGYTPRGVSLVISPWNFPFCLPFIQIVQSIAAGNSVVLKCSTATPLSAGLVEDLFREAGAPEGLVQRMLIPGSDMESVIRDPRVDIVVFTGSTEVGRRIASLCGELLKPVILELGGKDPAIVLNDADLSVTVQGILWGALMNAGQTCAGIERVYVEKSLYPEFLDRLVECVETLRMGDPISPETDIGPLTTKGQRKWVHGQVEQAKKAGAMVLTGGEIPEGKGFFYPPTVLRDVDHSMSIMKEETFGPLIPVMPVNDAEEAVQLAEDTPYGLTASVWTRSKDRAREMVKRLHAGTVTVNDHVITFVEPALPWLGVKESGMGHTHGRQGMRALGHLKAVSEEFLNQPRVWWFPYSKQSHGFFRTALTGLHGSGIQKLLKLTALSLSGVFWKKTPWRHILTRFWRLF